MHTHAIDKASILLKTEVALDYSISHDDCDLCEKDLSKGDMLLIEDMEEGKISVTADEKLAIFHIAGYFAFKHSELAGNPSDSTPNVRAFLEGINRGGLTYPSDKLHTRHSGLLLS